MLDSPTATKPDTTNLLALFESREERVFANRVDTAEAVPAEQFDMWQHCAAGIAELGRPGPLNAPFRGTMTNYFTSSIGYVQHTIHDHCHMDRTQKIIDTQEVELLAVQLRLSGQEVQHNLKADQLFSPGDIRIADLSQPLFSENPAYDNIGILVTKKELLDRLPRLDKLHGFTMQAGPMTNILKTHMQSVMAEMPGLSQLDAEKVASVTIEMLSAALLGIEAPHILESESMSGPVLRSVRICIENNLHKPGLNPDSIARMVGVSRTKLFQVCKPYGSPMELLHYRRMRRATELMKSEPSITISEVSFAVGYENRETFSRIFRREFGFSARDFLQSYRLNTPQ
ncbi:helix-turn-helix domain-containing protein [Kordiimonas pumila]|uniref:Helix-turn-helix domain-containing protein n=1 Tax=Kordiimonas pumila TaxID=2161677 RepID=A0ABV7D365_9PROT|nr:AraC family transcriptional regulator [Kordiimonas pumila]